MKLATQVLATKLEAIAQGLRAGRINPEHIGEILVNTGREILADDELAGRRLASALSPYIGR